MSNRHVQVRLLRSLLPASEPDRGDGTCKYLSGNLCSIYEKRPLLCRVDESYQKFFREVMSIDTYYRLNYEACQTLKNLEK